MTKRINGGTFDEVGFWSKVKRLGRKMGRTVLNPALLLYYLWMKPETPAWAKTIIASALVYLVCPMDAIPDMLPGGFVDDAGVLAGAVATLAAYIDEAVEVRAEAKAVELLGE